MDEARLAAQLEGFHDLRRMTEMHYDLQQTRVRLENIAFDGHQQYRDRAKDTDRFADACAAAAFAALVAPGPGSIPYSLAKAFPHVAAVRRAEDKLERDICGVYRLVVPPGLIAWQRTAHGVGELLMARLLGATGPPRWMRRGFWVPSCDSSSCEPDKQRMRHVHFDPVRERSVAEFWGYCGHGDPTRRRRKGLELAQLFEAGNPRAKMLVHLMSESAIRTRFREGDPPPFYRALYTDARRIYASRIHTADCAQCRAKEGDPWALGHQHAAALRYVGKRMLRDVWAAAK